MYNIPEQEQSEETFIKIGQEFSFFDPSRETKAISFNSTFKQKIHLEVGSYTIPLYTFARHNHSSISSIITPYHPGNGYTIDQRDFNLEKRIKKIREMHRRKSDFSKDPLLISIESELDFLVEHGIFPKHDTPKFPPEMSKLLNKLRLQIIIPGNGSEVALFSPSFIPPTSFETRAGPTALSLGRIDFHSFYPLDLGPLPNFGVENNNLNNLMNNIHEGLAIQVPLDLKLLETFKATFVLRNNVEDNK